MNDELLIDEKSGISIEEQKEILTRINGIAEKNRQSLSGNTGGRQAGKKHAINAKKSGAVFPMAANAAAAVILITGVILLLFFNSRTDAQIRTGSGVYGVTERALIEEIRRDTAQKIAEKEREISTIAIRLGIVDEELLQLYSSNVELTEEQRAAQERLLSLQISYRDDISVLQEERAGILEDSRSREARLRFQLDERTTAQTAAFGELDSAISELERLANEQARIQAADSQLAGGIASINTLIQNGLYDQAFRSIAALRLFTNSSSLASMRAFQSKRILYNQTLDFMESVITDVRSPGEAGITAGQPESAALNAQMESRIAEMQRTIDSFSAGSSGQERRLAELQETITSLQTQVSALRTENNTLAHNALENTERITLLEGIRTNLSSENSELRSTNAALGQQNTNLENQLTAIRVLLQEN